MIFALIVAGTPSIARTTMWALIIARAPAVIAARKGSSAPSCGS